MNILLIANYNQGLGGISGVVYNHFCKLQQEGFQVEIFSTKKSALGRLFLIFPLLLRVFKSDVIHIHGCSFLGFFPILIGLFASKVILNRRSIVTYHGGGADMFLRKNGWFAIPILKKSDVVTVMSKYLKDIFKKYDLGTVILPNLIEIEIDNKFEPLFDTPRLVSIRSLEKIYNIDDILLSFKMVKDRFPNAKLRIVGEGSLESELKSYASELQLKDIEFVGQINTQCIAVELKMSNIMISVPAHDNQPMSILEAFSIGIPVISSNVGGIPDMIKDQINGFLVEVHNHQQIFERIEWIMNNPNFVQIICQNAKISLINYKWDHVKKILLKLYLTN